VPTYVRTDKCDGCKGQDKTACMYICPHDLMKLDKDGGPTVGRPSQKSMDLFYLASYDLDNFRVFIASPFFHDVYDIEPAYFQKLLSDEVELMQFAFRYLKQVLFGENTIPEKPDALEKRKKRREEIIAKQREQMKKEMERDIDLPE